MLFTTFWLLAGCGDVPDLLDYGALELPGTAHADYLTARPFSVAPDASMLVFATSLTPAQRDGSTLDFDLARLASFRILDLDSGNQVELPGLPAEQHEMVKRYGLLHEAPCWHADSRTLLFRTGYRSYFRFGPLYANPTWSLVHQAPPGFDAGCEVRSPSFINSRAVGRFRIERDGAETLRVRHADAPAVLLEVAPEGLNDQVNVSVANLSPRGDRLALVYSQGVGSFSGKGHAVVVSVRQGEPPVRPLGRGVLVVDWIEDRRLVGYARPDGRRDHALFTWTLD